MITYATAQLLGDRSHQCDTTDVFTDPTVLIADIRPAA